MKSWSTETAPTQTTREIIESDLRDLLNDTLRDDGETTEQTPTFSPENVIHIQSIGKGRWSYYINLRNRMVNSPARRR